MIIKDKIKYWYRKIEYKIYLIRNVADELERRTSVEIYLLNCYQGKKPLPDKEKCRELAFKLGVPSELLKK